MTARPLMTERTVFGKARANGFDVNAEIESLMQRGEIDRDGLDAYRAERTAEWKQLRATKVHEEHPAQDAPPVADPAASAVAPVYCSFDDLVTNPPIPRQWVVENWIPACSVTALFGAGGIGKSLVLQELATAVATGQRWAGARTTAGTVLGFFCEDNPNELRLRQIAIDRHRKGSSDYVHKSLYLEGRAGKDNALMIAGASERVLLPTPTLHAIEGEIARLRPILVGLDNIAQMFGGLENDRHSVTTFVNRLTGWATRYGCAVLILGHVAKALGSEFSGSTAWDAAVRTRLQLERREDGLLALHRRKSNYAALDTALLEYRDGTLVHIEGAGHDTVGAEAARAAIKRGLAHFTKQGVATSASPNSRSYLPRLIEGAGQAAGLSRTALARALAHLIETGSLNPHATLPWRKSDRHAATGIAPVMEE